MTVGWLLLLRLSHPMSRSALEAGPADASAVDWPSVWDTDHATGTTARRQLTGARSAGRR